MVQTVLKTPRKAKLTYVIFPNDKFHMSYDILCHNMTFISYDAYDIKI
jgi:hypothetical protein